MTPDSLVHDRLWSWLMDEGHVCRGLAIEYENALIGIAHFRTFPRPIVAAHGLFLDDLFINSSVRGLGAATAVLTHLSHIAHEEGASLVRWITADSNDTARRVYNRVATQTPWITYDLRAAEY